MTSAEMPGNSPGAAPGETPGDPRGIAPAKALAWRSRAEFRQAQGVLLVLRDPPRPPPPTPGQPPTVPGNPAEGPEVLLALADDGQVVALAGHVDLGTGISTAYAQIVAEELDLPLHQVHLVLGDTGRAPNQGPTIASTSLQIHAQPLWLAAAQSRLWLVAQAAARWALPAGDLRTLDGAVLAPDGQSLAYSELVAGGHVELMLDAATPTKAPADYRVVGQSVPRQDLLAKVLAKDVYVHDLRLPGLLHGRVVRPPYAGLDAGDFVGRSLLSVDEASVAHLPGFKKLVVIGDFIGLVTEREEQAEAAMLALKAQWAPFTPTARLDDLAQAISANPSTARVVAQQGDVDSALAAAGDVDGNTHGKGARLDRDYVWPYQLHASIGPSCAVAQWFDEGSDDAQAGRRATVWAGTQNPHVLRADLAKLSGQADTAIDVVRLEAAGCYGRNGADDVAADALLLARAMGGGVPVRVQLTRAQEMAWEPKGAAQLMQVRGGLDAQGAPLAYDFATSYPSNGAPTLALLLTGTVPAVAQAFEMGDRTAVPPYAYPHQRITVNDMAPILRASWLRGVSALPNSFAHESYIDELASAAGVDPVAYRLRHLPDVRAAELLRATADKAGWKPHTTPQAQPVEGPQGEWLTGQGVAYARYVHSRFPGFGAAWAVWVADVAVHRDTGEVQVRRVVVGHDAGLMVNPAGVLQQVHGNVLQTTSRALKERLPIDPNTQTPQAREFGAYPILSFREVPTVEVLLMPRPGEPALGAGESASVPGTAAIANAIFDATGVRFRQPPFTPEVVRAAIKPLATLAGGSGPGGQAGASGDSPLGADATPLPLPTLRAAHPLQRPRRWWALAGALSGALVTGLAGLLVGAWGGRPAMAPVVGADAAGLYRPEVVERGRQLAALGNCISCHTAADGPPGAGGRPVVTPFGTVYTTNLTPDVPTGLGAWSFSAFARALREGVSRQGQHLYPAFPYTAFALTSDADAQALYAYLMAQPAVVRATPPADMGFPYNQRALLGLWKAVYMPAQATDLAADQAPVQAPVQAPEQAPEQAAGSRPAIDAAAMAPGAMPEARSAQWQRGAYLVNGVGHCGACHTPRDALGGEKLRTAYLGGAMVNGWEAPALGALSRSALPWTETSLLAYLRHGAHASHGVAGGPMAEVVRGLAQVAEVDVRAIAHYLVSLQPADPDRSPASPEALVARAAAGRGALLGPSQRLFESACGACHHDGDGPKLLGLNQPLALNNNLHSARPDNLVRTLLEGINDPAFVRIGHMPGFAHVLDDQQVSALAAWMRLRFAPDQPPWPALPEVVAKLRASPSTR